jgi:hypothetical protein
VSQRLVNASPPAEAKDSRGNVIPGSLDIHPENAIPGELVVRLMDHAVVLPAGRENEVFTIDDASPSLATQELLRDIRAQTIERVARNVQSLVREGYWRSVFKVTVPYDADLETTVRALRRHGNVLWANTNGRVHTTAVPNDSIYHNAYFNQVTQENVGPQWNLNPTISALHVDVQDVWDPSNRSVGHESVKLGVYDTGVQYNHPDLGGGIGQGKLFVGGWDYINNDDTPLPTFDLHGTWMAGVVAAITNNGLGIAGVAGGVG